MVGLNRSPPWGEESVELNLPKLLVLGGQHTDLINDDSRVGGQGDELASTVGRYIEECLTPP